MDRQRALRNLVYILVMLAFLGGQMGGSVTARAASLMPSCTSNGREARPLHLFPSGRDVRIDQVTAPGAASPTGVDIAGPGILQVDETASFTATVLPASVTMPITFTWETDEMATPYVYATQTNTQSVRTLNWCVAGGHFITVTVANAEGSTAMVRRVRVLPPPLPDLVVTNVNYNGSYIVYQMMNTGDVTVTKTHTATLWIDGVYRDTDIIDHVTLGPGDRLKRQFPRTSTCSGIEDTFRVVADATRVITEQDESNNERTEIWACDPKAPLITRGPATFDVTQTEATIRWSTDEAADSVVLYGTRKGAFDQAVSNAVKTTSHELLLKGLQPATTYEYKVQSVDDAGNVVSSGAWTFETLAPTASSPPSPTITMRRDPDHPGYYLLEAKFSDPSSVERVAFLLNGIPVGVDYGNRMAPTTVMVQDSLLPQATPPGPRDTYRVSFRPHLFGHTRETFLDQQQQVTAQVYGWNRTLVSAIDYVQTSSTSEPINVDLSIQNPPPDHTIFITGDSTPSSTMVDLDIQAIQYNWACEYHPFSIAGDCSEVMRSVERVQVFLDNRLVTELFPSDDQDYDFQTALDLSNRMPNSYYVKVRAFDTEGQAYLTETWIDVVQQLPDLNVTRDVRRFGPRFRVRLTVENLPDATGPAMLKQVVDYVRSFQVAQDHEPDYRVFADYNPWSGVDARESEITIDFPMAPNDVYVLDPGESVVLEYWMVPILYEDDTTYEIGHKHLEVMYRELSWDWETTTFIREVDLLYNQVIQALEHVDYLIVTHPGNLMAGNAYNVYVDQLLMKIGDLARYRSGAVGYLESANPRDTLDNLISAGGWWSAPLHPDFETEGGGYLLIVGEQEIVPAWDLLDVALTDYPYADTGGSMHPDLVVGRIIGNSVLDLAKPIQASIDVIRQEADFDRSKAWLIAGGGEGQEQFSEHLDQIQDILYNDVGITSHSKGKAVDYHVIDSTPYTLQGPDSFAAGFVTGGAIADGVVGDASHDVIRMIDPTTGVELDSFAQAFDVDDQLAVGDVVAPGYDEIVMGDVSNGQIHLFNTGVTYSFTPYPYGFCADCFLALGDVNGDGGDEILFGYPGSLMPGHLSVYDALGSQIAGAGFDFDFSFHDALAAGDVVGGPADEIIVADGALGVSPGAIRVYDQGGNLLASTSLPFSAFLGGQIAVGNIRYLEIAGQEEIVVKIPRWIYVYRVDAAEASLEMIYRMYVPWMEQADEMVVGDVVGDDRDEILIVSAQNDAIAWLDIFYCDRFLPVMEPQTVDADILIYQGHGNPGAWGCVTEFPMGFGNARPMAWGATCLSGNYEGSEDHGIAESFFDQHGAVFVGATEVSYSNPNVAAIQSFFSTWGDESIGDAFFDLERTNFGSSDSWLFWTTEYNLYGDPQFGNVPQPGRASSDVKRQATTAPTNTLTLDLPALVVNSSEGIDTVTIPGGAHWLKVDEARVPIWRATYDYPPGVRVQEIALDDRSGLETYTGWVLPLNTPATDVRTSPTPLSANGDAMDNWVTDLDIPYAWEVWDNTDGSTTLALSVYPFFYHAATTESQYYRHYDFTITTTTTALTITHLGTGASVYELGDWVDVDLEIQNDDPALDVVVEADIQDVAGNVVSGLLLRSLHDLSGQITFDPGWDSTGTPPGDYRAVVVLRDAAGMVLDRAEVRFRLGTVQGEVVAFDVTPETFADGPNFDATLTFSNTGTVPITGTALVEVYPADAMTMTTVMTGTLINVQPGATAVFSTTWDATEVPNQAYRLHGLVKYDGQATQPVVFNLEAGNQIYLPLVLRE